jgi:two-component sensor histidine kinase
MGCFLFFFISVKTGPDAFSILYFFPFVLVLAQMLGRRETYVHLVILFILCFLTILAIIFSYQFSLFNIVISDKLTSYVKYVNIIISFFIAIAYVFIISFEANKQERQLKSAIKQKDVLLAELFHRVKNNLNIVTSLLNLKKNSMTSREAQSALEECREMVFSMALVHNKMYTSNNIEQLNFKDYLDTLIPELVRSFGGKEKVDVEVIVPEIIFDLSQAIPCGLIINEFITNAFKHAQVEGRKLKIQVNLVEENGYVDIELNDNGPGVMTPQQEESSLGLGLIKSLTDQLGGTCNFKNNNGLKFNLKFKR